MYKHFKRNVAAAAQNAAMEAENHVKHGASSKSLMSRANFLIAICLAIFCGCDKDNDKDKDENTTRLAKVNIGNAKYIVQSQSQSSGTRSATLALTKNSSSIPGGFYQIDENGNIEPILFIDEIGDTVSLNININNVVDVNSDFLLFFGSFPSLDENGNPVHYSTILVNKITEIIYALPNSFFISPYAQISSDEKGNIYIDHYIINVIDNTIEEFPSLAGAALIDQKNGLYFFRGPTGSRMRHRSSPNRIVLMSDLIKINGFDYDDLMSGHTFGYDNRIYHIRFLRYWDENHHYSYGDTIRIYRMDDVSNDISATLISKYEADRNWHASYIGRDNALYFNHINNSFFILDGVSSDIFEFNFTHNNWRSFQLPNTLSDFTFKIRWNYYTKFVSKESFFYFDPNTGRDFYRLDLTTYDVTHINISGYEIYEVTSSINSNEISFTGLRYSDSKSIIGRIDSLGNVSIVSEGDNNDERRVEKLIQLN